MCNHLVTKYNVPGPRYTSYPTVPYWDKNSFSLSAWKASVQQSFGESNAEQGISLYIHLPFCESMCTFCGCNKRITKNHDVEIPYIRSLIREWRLYVDLLDKRPVIREIHIGGGTPTFFSPENLQLLLRGIFNMARKPVKAEMSFEGHPNNTTPEHLQALSECGFTRVSYGVQDYNPEVQNAIHRIQSFTKVQDATNSARVFGFNSVGHDIIYGLPFQTREHIKYTIERTLELLPERIAFYRYAHVPWIKGNGQRGFKESDLPTAEEKREQFEIGKKMLLKAGYKSIGMDHFALPNDSLFEARSTGKLHRNFMGYTSSKTQLMLSLGVSAISDSWYGYSQNVKGVEEYQDLLAENILPVYRGHILNDQDLRIRKHILDLMCRFETRWDSPEMYFDELPSVLRSLEELERAGLIEVGSDYLKVNREGEPFIRNICMAFDLRLKNKWPENPLFSMTI